MNEKQIDELARMIRDYVRTGSEDVRLRNKLFEFIEGVIIEDGWNNYPDLDMPRYFLQSLKRELTEPEVVRRRYSYPHGFWQEETNYP